MSDRKQWLRELRAAEKEQRFLIDEPDPSRMLSDREQCVFCGRRTSKWLMPENTPLCGDECLAEYLKDPSIYDPREIHTRPSPRLACVDGVPVKPFYAEKKKRRNRKPGRWEPSDEEIKEMQKKIAEQFGLRKNRLDNSD